MYVSYYRCVHSLIYWIITLPSKGSFNLVNFGGCSVASSTSETMAKSINQNNGKSIFDGQKSIVCHCYIQNVKDGIQI